MIVNYTRFDTNTGRVTGSGFCSDIDLPLQPETGEDVIQQPTDAVTQYVNTATEAVVDRPVNPAALDKTTITADGVDKATISGIPKPSTVHVDGSEVEVTDGVLEITANGPTSISVRVASFPELEKEFTVDAI